MNLIFVQKYEYVNVRIFIITQWSDFFFRINAITVKTRFLTDMRKVYTI